MVTRLLWVLQHPTPYNVYLLNGLHERLRIPCEAIYRASSLPSHPWSSLPIRRFAWRVIERSGARDPELGRRCKSDPSTLVVFGGWRDATIRPALLARVRAGLPFAFWTDTPKTGRGPARRLLNALFVRFATRAVATLATGTPAIEGYRRMGVPADRLENFPFVVDPEHFAASRVRRAGRSPGEVVRFVIPARLVDRLKGQGVALEALARLPSERACELVLAGTGPDEGVLRAAAERLGVAASVRFTGWVEYDDLPALLGTADALVLPSHWDPFPVAVIEAMVSGLPVLGSDACGSVRERVEPGKNGFVHRAGDVAALAEHMRCIVSDPEVRTRMGERARETAARWGIEHSTRVLSRVLARASAHGDAQARHVPSCAS